MRSAILLLLGLILTACENTLPVPTTIPSPTLIASTGRLSDVTLPTPLPGRFWSNDEPKELPPFGFGVLPFDKEPGPPVTVGAYDLATPFPSFPRELDAYLVGAYPEKYCTVLLSIVKNLQDWDCIPSYALIQYRGATALGDRISMVTQSQIEQRAVQVLKERGLLMPDQFTPTAYKNDDGTWRVLFFQRIDGIPIYVNKGLAVRLNRDALCLLRQR